MKWDSLKSCFGISILCHAVLFGVIAFGGFGKHQPALQQEDELITLTLIAAPAEPVAPAPVVQVVAPAMVQPLPVEKPVELPVPIEPLAVLPKPEPAVVAPQPKPAVVVAPPAPPPSVRGDNSSVKPGPDAITQQARPSVVDKPNYLNNPDPPYPPQARRRGWEGSVMLTVKVTAQGRAASVEIKKSSGYALLDNAAMQAVRDWKFEPAKINSIAIASEVEVPVTFMIPK